MAVVPSQPGRGRFALPAAHFAVATCYLVAAAAGLVWIAPQLAAGAFASPRVAGVTHLFTLGWLTTTIFGALYQLMPSALGAPIRWPRIGYASLAAFAPGVAACVWWRSALRSPWPTWRRRCRVHADAT